MPWTAVNETGWIADIAGVIVPTQTELIEMKMIPRPPRWNHGGNNDGYEVKHAAWKALYEPINRLMTCLVEVKATRSDFRGDRKWKLTPPVDLAYLAIPPGIVKKEEWPEGWGILELRGDTVAQIRIPTVRAATLQQHFSFIYQLALCCDHRVRRAVMREEQKLTRINDAERILISRIDKIVSAVHDIAAGHVWWSEKPLTSVEQVLTYHGIKNVRAAQLEQLATLFKIAARKDS
jgi:hypothetical protein